MDVGMRLLNRHKNDRAMKTRIFVMLIAAVAMACGVSHKQKQDAEYLSGIPKTIELTSDDFQHQGTIPREFADFSENISPSLKWSNIPNSTKSFVITVTDYDAPSPEFKTATIHHWLLYNIKPELRSLKRGVSSEELTQYGITVGSNYRGKNSYNGPNPPMGEHSYYFRIYALSIPRIEEQDLKTKDVKDVIKDHILAYGELIGKMQK